MFASAMLWEERRERERERRGRERERSGKRGESKRGRGGRSWERERRKVGEKG